MTNRGRFIVIEGLEGAGKSTAIKTIEQFLSAFVPEVILTREPGGTTVGEAIRHLIKTKVEGETLDSRCELLLLYAARVQLIEQVIRPALARGAWILADRFELSTFAYQGWGRGLGMEMISHLSKFCLQSLKPDLTIYLDIDPVLGFERVVKRGAKDRIEQEELSFFKQVHQGYQEMIQTMDKVAIIDASQPLKSVQEAIRKQLSHFLHDHAAS